jgi:hypothetical protein
MKILIEYVNADGSLVDEKFEPKKIQFVLKDGIELDFDTKIDLLAMLYAAGFRDKFQNVQPKFAHLFSAQNTFPQGTDNHVWHYPNEQSQSSNPHVLSDVPNQ